MKRRRETWRKLGIIGKEEGESRRRREKEREEGERRVYMDGKAEKNVVQNKREGLFKIILGFRGVEIRNLSRMLPIYLFLDWNSFREQSSISPTLGYLSSCSTDRALWQVGEQRWRHFCGKNTPVSVEHWRPRKASIARAFHSWNSLINGLFLIFVMIKFIFL